MSVRISNSQITQLRTIESSSGFERCLNANQIARLDENCPCDMILCTRGVLWVTQNGDQQDYLLRPGEKFVLLRSGMVLVQALKDSACWSYLD